MGHFYRNVLTMCFSLAVIASAFAGDRLSIEGDGAAEWPVEAADIVVQRRLAGAVAAQQRHDLAGADRKIDAAQHLDGAVARPQRADLKHAAPWRHRARDRLR